MFFTAGGREQGRDPYFGHLYSANFDGSELTLLTPEDANHTIAFSKDGTSYIDTQSRVDLPSIVVNKRVAGGDPLRLMETLVKLADCKITLLESSNLHPGIHSLTWNV